MSLIKAHSVILSKPRMKSATISATPLTKICSPAGYRSHEDKALDQWFDETFIEFLLNIDFVDRVYFIR